MIGRRAALALVLPFVALGGCGGDGDSDGDRASKAPQAILEEVADALAGVKSYHLEGTQEDADGTTRMVGDVSAAGEARFELSIGGKAVTMVVADGKNFMRADAEFWNESGGAAVGEALDGRWVAVPASQAGSFKELIDGVVPATLAHCLRATKSTLTKAPTEKVGDTDAVVIVSAGDAPGESPGRLFVPASGQALPLRMTADGPSKPGKIDARCDDEDSTRTAQDVTLSDFDEPVDIAAPRDALDLASVAG